MVSPSVMPNGDFGIDGQYDEVLACADRVLTERLGAAVQLGKVERISEPRRRNLLLRCHVMQGPMSAPASVILKRARLRKYDPDNPKSRPAVGLFRDWAGLEFLNSVANENLACPKFYGGDRQAGFFLMEDLGGHRDLDHLLTRGSANEARCGLIRLAAALGRMHAVTAGCGEQYQNIRDSLGPGDGMHRKRLAKHIHDYAPLLRDQLASVSVTMAPGLNEDLETIGASMAEPGDFLTYTHADACPDNSILVGDRVCLIDYEFGSFRHALLDGVYGWIRFPTCWCVRDIPDAAVAEMESEYRGQLSQGCPAALDDERYFHAVAEACGYWMLQTLSQLFERALLYEEPKGTSTNRQRILMRLIALEQVLTRAGHLEGLRETMDSLSRELRRRWHHDIPVYDAFSLKNELPQDDIHEIADAVRSGQVDQVARLLHRNQSLAQAKLDDADQTPLLFVAVESQVAETVELLLSHGADWRTTTRSGWSVLGRACAHSTPAIVDLLLKQGADLNQRDVWGTLPLYGASSNRAMMLHLLKRGAKADLKMAVDMDRLDVAERILGDNPSQARIRFGTGLTLLHDSARVGDTRLAAMDLLLRFGADVNAVTNWGATPLHLAVFHRNAKATKFLIDHGASLDARDDFGLTPLRLAEATQNAACIDLLTHAGEPLSTGGWSASETENVVMVSSFEQSMTDSSRVEGRDPKIEKIDALYRAIGDLGDSTHPMDYLANDALLATPPPEPDAQDHDHDRDGDRTRPGMQ